MALFDLWTRSGSPVRDVATGLDFSLWARDGHPIRRREAAQPLQASGVASAEALGLALLAAAPILQPTGVLSEEAHGSAAVVPWLTPTGVPSEEALGTVLVLGVLAPSGLSSGEALGTPNVIPQIAPLGLTTGEALGNALVGFSPPIASVALALGWAPTRAILGGSARRVHVGTRGPTRLVLPSPRVRVMLDSTQTRTAV
jgi:hypothetical protein